MLSSYIKCDLFLFAVLFSFLAPCLFSVLSSLGLFSVCVSISLFIPVFWQLSLLSRVANILARDPTDILARDLTYILARDPTDILARDPTDILARDLTYILARDPTDILARDPTNILARDSTYILARDPTDILARDLTYIIARDPTDILARNPTYILARDPTFILARDPTYILAFLVAWDRRCDVSWWSFSKTRPHSGHPKGVTFRCWKICDLASSSLRQLHSWTHIKHVYLMISTHTTYV